MDSKRTETNVVLVDSSRKKSVLTLTKTGPYNMSNPKEMDAMRVPNGLASIQELTILSLDERTKLKDVGR
jgi:hypothetical protein